MRLQVAQIVALKATDIDSTRMLIGVQQGKGRKDRHTTLSPQLLELLRAWWWEGKCRGVMLPQGWPHADHAGSTGVTSAGVRRGS